MIDVGRELGYRNGGGISVLLKRFDLLISGYRNGGGISVLLKRFDLLVCAQPKLKRKISHYEKLFHT